MEGSAKEDFSVPVLAAAAAAVGRTKTEETVKVETCASRVVI